MSKRADRAQRITEWLEHLQGWKDSGKALAAYARDHGLTLWAMYHWRGVLIREGRWRQEPRPKASGTSPVRSPPALRFAKVAVSELCSSMALTVRLHLANGRRAEVDLSGIEQLEMILGALERQP